MPTTPASDKTTELLQDIASMLEDADVRGRLLDVLVEREIQSRIELLDGALKKRAEQLIELRKAEKGDQVQYDEYGAEVGRTFSKDKFEALKKTREGLAKTEKAIEDGLGGDFKKLKELK
jgi:hypothetical protein